MSLKSSIHFLKAQHVLPVVNIWVIFFKHLPVMTGPRNSSPFLFLKPFSSNSRSSAFIDCHISVQAWGSKHVWENLHIKHQQLAQALSSYSDTALSTTQSFKLLQVPPVVFWLASALVIDCEWEAWNIRLQNSVLKLNLFFLYIKDFFFFQSKTVFNMLAKRQSRLVLYLYLLCETTLLTSHGEDINQ